MADLVGPMAIGGRLRNAVICALLVISLTLLVVVTTPSFRYFWHLRQLESDSATPRAMAAWWLAQHEPQKSIRPLMNAWIRAYPGQTERFGDSLSERELNTESLALLAASAAVPEQLAFLAMDPSEQHSVRMGAFRMLSTLGFYGLRNADVVTVTTLACGYGNASADDQAIIALTLSSYARSTGSQFHAVLKPIIEHDPPPELGDCGMGCARCGLRHTLATKYPIERNQEYHLFDELYVAPTDPEWLSRRWTIANPAKFRKWLLRYRARRIRRRVDDSQ